MINIFFLEVTKTINKSMVAYSSHVFGRTTRNVRYVRVTR